MNCFQERFDELLNERELSRLQLANKLNISSTTINGYFNNNYFPTIDIAIKLADEFDCSLNFLFGLTDIKGKFFEFKKENLLSTFNSNLLFLIKQNGMSISKCMKALKMSEYNFYRWRDGKFPKTVNLISIAKFFEVSIDVLIGQIM